MSAIRPRLSGRSKAQPFLLSQEAERKEDFDPPEHGSDANGLQANSGHGVNGQKPSPFWCKGGYLGRWAR
ncbi:hypothetical protein V6Z12_D01G213500 [Gossypium hirsutum]